MALEKASKPLMSLANTINATKKRLLHEKMAQTIAYIIDY